MTTCEREIAELSLGRTNREIAATVFLAEKAVEAHLSRVFGEPGVTKRAAIGGVLAARA